MGSEPGEASACASLPEDNSRNEVPGAKRKGQKLPAERVDAGRSGAIAMVEDGEDGFGVGADFAGSRE